MIKNFTHKRYWFPLCITLILSTATLLLYLYFLGNMPKRLAKEIKITGELTLQDFKGYVEQNVQSIGNLRARVEDSHGEYLKYWRPDASRIIDQNASINFMQWVDSNSIVREMVPAAGNEAFINKPTHQDPERKQNWLQHIRNNTLNISSYPEDGKGKHFFVVDFPVNFNDKFQGSITAEIDFARYFAKMGPYLKGFAVAVKDKRGNVLYSFHNPQPKAFSEDLIFSQKLILDGNKDQFWTFDLMFEDVENPDGSTFFTDTAFIFGLMMSCLLGVVFYYYFKALHAVKTATESNDKLVLANNELEEERERATRASQAKTEFVANMSHEIRTPLNAILGISELLKGSAVNEESRHYLELMEKSSKALMALINDVLLIDKIEAGKEKLSEDTFSPLEVVNNMVSFYRAKIENKGLKLNYKYVNARTTQVIGDRARLEQILISLIGNAVKFTHTGSISIRYKEVVAASDQLKIQITVTDTGLGIPNDKLDYIFERFTQLDSGVRKKHPGGGLGLYITKQHIALMQGTIKVESEQHVGASFIVGIDFPLLEHEPGVPQGTKLEFCNLADLRVLAVDDNKLNNIILSKVLKMMEMETDLAFNGLEALRKVGTQDFDLIFMDVHMPEMDGFETTRRIREKHKRALIIGLSADATQSAIDEGYRAGMDHYLTKPLDREKLEAVLNMHFGAQYVN